MPKGEFGRADKPDENPRRAPRAPLRTVEPFPGGADIRVLGNCISSFYGNAAERTYSALAALLF